MILIFRLLTIPNLEILKAFYSYFIICFKHSSQQSTSLKYSTSFSVFLHYFPSLLPHRTINDLFIYLQLLFHLDHQKTVKHNENKIKFRPIIHFFIRTQSKTIQSYFNLTILFILQCGNSSYFTICRAYYEIR